MEYKNLQLTLQKLSPTLVNLYRQNIDSSGSNASGALANNISFEVVKGDSFYAVDFRLMDYWKYVENGRKPGKWPNLNAIQNWISVKRIAPRAYNGKLPTLNELTYLISRKIALKGIEPKNLLSKAINTFEENYIQLIEDAITKDLSNEIDFNLNAI